jgi:hypothetical protein
MPRFVFYTPYGKVVVDPDPLDQFNPTALLSSVSFEPSVVSYLKANDKMGSYRHFFHTVAQQAAAGIDCGAKAYREWVFETLERMDP